MELEKIREFLVFYDYLNFTTAARALNLTQSTLSKHIGDIEDELGVQLVERGNAQRANTLTPAGQVFLERAQGVLDAYDDLAASCRAAAHNAPLARIMAVQFDVNMSPQIRDALAALGSGAAGRQYVYEKVAIDIKKALDDGLVDFAVHYEGSPAMAGFDTDALRDTYGWIRLEPERLCIMVDGANPLVGQGPVALERLSRRTVVNLRSSAYRSWYSALELVCAQNGWDLHLKLVSERARDDAGFYLNADEICLCTRRFFEYNRNLGVQDLVELPVEGFDACVQPFLVYRLDNTNPHVRAIVEGFAAR